MENFAEVNWIAVSAGAFISFLAGWLWYSPKLFGEKWAEGAGVPLDDMAKVPLFAMTSQIAALLLLSTVIGVAASVDALVTAVLIILTLAIFTASNGAFGQNSNSAICIDFGYTIVVGAIMIGCQGIL